MSRRKTDFKYLFSPALTWLIMLLVAMGIVVLVCFGFVEAIEIIF